LPLFAQFKDLLPSLTTIPPQLVACQAQHVGWDERLFDLLDDLEGEAVALFAAERDAELADRSRAEYASVTLASRLMASQGRSVALEVDGVGGVRGELRRVGNGWCLVSGDAGDWLVPVEAVASAEGLSDRAVPEVAWSPVARLGLGSALRRLADDATRCVVFTRAGGRHEVRLTRVGRDFAEAQTVGDEPRRLLLALSSVGAVQSREPR
jgi:hypothetical protein